MPVKKTVNKKSVDTINKEAEDTLGEATTASPKYVRKGKKIQITLTIAQPLLEEVDSLAQDLGLSRAAVINLAIHQGMIHGINVSGTRNN